MQHVAESEWRGRHALHAHARNIVSTMFGRLFLSSKLLYQSGTRSGLHLHKERDCADSFICFLAWSNLVLLFLSVNSGFYLVVNSLYLHFLNHLNRIMHFGCLLWPFGAFGVTELVTAILLFTSIPYFI